MALGLLKTPSSYTGKGGAGPVRALWPKLSLTGVLMRLTRVLHARATWRFRWLTTRTRRSIRSHKACGFENGSRLSMLATDQYLRRA
jgi:hypothetical protein